MFEECTPETLDRFAARLEVCRLGSGARLIREGDEGLFFALITTGQVAVARDGPGGLEHLAFAGPGALVGELSLLRGQPRGATVTATMPTVALTGDADAFESLLELPGVLERMRRLVAERLARDVHPVPATLIDGAHVLLRPLLPSDRDGIAAAIREMSQESLRRRFFTGGQPSERMIDYLVDIDYVNHFAWLLLNETSTEGFATARYIRRPDAPDQAEVAFTVSDRHQGRGIGGLLLGAIGAAASICGIRRFTGTLLSDNRPMRAVLAKGAASFAFDEPGVLTAELSVDQTASLLADDLRHDLQAAAYDVVTAAGLALANPGAD
jgi:CRP-like cAMP-binding protein